MKRCCFDSLNSFFYDYAIHVQPYTVSSWNLFIFVRYKTEAPYFSHAKIIVTSSITGWSERWDLSFKMQFLSGSARLPTYFSEDLHTGTCSHPAVFSRKYLASMGYKYLRFSVLLPFKEPLCCIEAEWWRRGALSDFLCGGNRPITGGL